MTQRNIVTLKWGDRYDADYVNKLLRASKRNLKGDFRFVCFTDDASDIDPAIETFPIPDIDIPERQIGTGWRKLCLFRDDLPLEGLCLFFDLDIVITGPLDDYFTYKTDNIAIIHNWVHWRKSIFEKRPEIGNSSVFRWRANKHAHVVEQYLSEKDWALNTFSPPQSYLSHCIREHMIYWPEGWVKSFKRHCRPTFPLNFIKEPKLPRDASIIAFHGKPDPDEALAGYKGNKIHHRSLPTKWIQKHWK